MSMRSFFCLFPTTHPSLSLLKIQQDMTQSELSQLIAALRAETQQNAVGHFTFGQGYHFVFHRAIARFTIR